MTSELDDSRRRIPELEQQLAEAQTVAVRNHFELRAILEQQDVAQRRVEKLESLLSEAASYIEFCHRCCATGAGHYGPCLGGVGYPCDEACVYMRGLFDRVASCGVEMREPKS